MSESASTDKVVVEFAVKDGVPQDGPIPLAQWLQIFEGSPVRVTIERLDRIGGDPVSAFARGGLGGPNDV